MAAHSTCGLNMWVAGDTSLTCAIPEHHRDKHHNKVLHKSLGLFDFCYFKNHFLFSGTHSVSTCPRSSSNYLLVLAAVFQVALGWDSHSSSPSVFLHSLCNRTSGNKWYRFLHAGICQMSFLLSKNCPCRTKYKNPPSCSSVSHCSVQWPLMPLTIVILHAQ